MLSDTPRHRLALVLFCVGLLFSFSLIGAHAAEKRPVRLALVGLVHGHAGSFIRGLQAQSDVHLVGLVDPDEMLQARFAKTFSLDRSMFYSSLASLFEATPVDAVAVFTSTYDHVEVVEACVARGLPVMMEKPLAVSMEHARRMATASEKAGVPVIVNYETTWYPAHRALWELVREQKAIGEVRKIMVNDGHSGPVEIGCSQEFLSWLTDPVLNGGGALMDFGCYGANLITWLVDGQRPTAVQAVTQQIKPHVYPNVDDEATILLTYPHFQGVIQASWNWPFSRKDIEVYGTKGYVIAPRGNEIRVRTGKEQESKQTPAALQAPYAGPISYFAAIVRKEIEPSGLSSLENNLVVTEILDAARESARTGKRVDLPLR